MTMQTYNYRQRSLPKNQRGASVSGVILLLMAMGILLKLAIAIIPAQIEDYRVSSLAAEQLALANANKDTPKEFMQRVDDKLSTNALYNVKAESRFKFTNKKPGGLALYKDYEVVNNFFGNIDIVNRFEGEIVPKVDSE